MGFEHVFAEQFDESLQVALKTGVRGALVAGTGYGVANGLIYIAQGLIYYVGAVMMARGTYTYLQLLEVVNLVVFSVSIAAQIMTFGKYFTSYPSCELKVDDVLQFPGSRKPNRPLMTFVG